MSRSRSRPEKSGPGPADEDQPQGPPRPGGRPGAGGQAQHQLMLVPVGLAAVLVRAGAVPLPGRVEIRDLDDAAQVAGALGVAARAAPVVLPERRDVKFGVVGFDRQGLPEPVDLPAAVGAREDHEIAADQSEQVTEQRRRQPLSRRFAAVIADDPRQGAQVPSAGCYRASSSRHPPPGPGYSGCGRQDIRRTADGRDHPARTPWQVSGRS